MVITVEAIYENGVLRPTQQLPFEEKERVQVTVAKKPSVADQTYGMMGWTGSAEDLDYLIESAENEPLEGT
jgi:predicted DNA-binding antitoxin AbrB/MazE fold protein